MGEDSKIEWTTHTFNPWWGCTKVAAIDRWWGSSFWNALKDMSQLAISALMAERLQKELGYRFANVWPVFLSEKGQKVPFVLIHASDHPQAPILMRRAYTAV